MPHFMLHVGWGCAMLGATGGLGLCYAWCYRWAGAGPRLMLQVGWGTLDAAGGMELCHTLCCKWAGAVPHFMLQVGWGCAMLGATGGLGLGHA